MPLIKLPNFQKTETLSPTAEIKTDQTVTTFAPTTVQIGLRTEKTATDKYGWQIVDSIPYDEPCVLYVGGDGARTDRAANGYAKIIENDILKPLGIKLPVYSIKYNFASHGGIMSRAIGFMKNRAEPLFDAAERKEKFAKEASADDFNPQYIDYLYKKIIEPRISISHGKGKLPAHEACRRMRMITFVAHCHGGYVMLELEKKMRAEMKRLNYDLNESKQILSQMLTVAHSPACALGIAKSQMISFSTVNDVEWPKSVAQRVNNNFFNNYLFDRKREHLRHQNAVIDGDKQLAAENRPLDIKPCYFAPQQGNLFLIDKKMQPTTNDPFQHDGSEHGDIGYGYAGKTQAGQMMTYIAGNIIKNGVKNSLEQKSAHTPLPPLQTLIQGESSEANAALNKIFPKMIANGKALRRKIYNYALSKLQKVRNIR